MSYNAKLILLGLLASTAATNIARAEPAGVAALVKQGHYWQGRGRSDLANQAFRRVLTIDPANVEARAALSGAAPKPTPAAPATAAKPVAQKPVAAPRPAQPPVVAAASRPVAPPAPRPVADSGGNARAAGFQALEAGDIASAASRFQSALQRNRNDADAAGGLGLVRLRQERFAEARDLLQRASQRGNAGKWTEALSSARFYAQLQDGQAALDAGRLDDGQRIAEALIASDFAKKQPALDLLAGIYERQGRYADAAQTYDKALSLAGPNQRVNNGNSIRAQALGAVQSGNAALAEQLFQRGLITDPADPWIRYEFARFLESKGRRADVDGLIGSLGNMGNPEALYAAALLNSQTRRPADAEALLDRIPATARTAEMRELAFSLKTDAAIARARAMTSQGLGSQASAGLRQLAATRGLSSASQGAIAEALLDMGDSAGATMVAQQALSANDSDPAAMEPVIRVLSKTGQDMLAQSAVQRLASRVGGSADGQRALGKLNGNLAAAQADRLRESGQYAAAFDLLQGQWNAAPGSADVLNALARLYQSGGMPLQAAQTYQIVLNQSPDDVGAMIGMIDAASAAGNYTLAYGAFQRAATVAPSDYNLYLAAARMEQAHGNDRTAKRYMQRARELYIGKSRPAAGGFGASNPFAARAAATNGPFSAPQQQPANPFALTSTPVQMQQPFGVQQQPQPSVPGFYAPPARGGPGGFASTPAAFTMQADSPAPISDPVLASIDRDMRALSTDTGPRIDVETGFRSRSGEEGLSSLKELSGQAQFSTNVARGRVSLKARAVLIDAGRPTGSGLQRFGRNPTAEAVGIVAQLPSRLTNADTQSASGVMVSAGYEDKLIKADVGTTPLGFHKNHVAAGIVLTPRLSRYSSVRLWAERRPVTDSVIAYAGTTDPVSGRFWGAVMKNGGGLGYSYDQDGSGLYGDVSYYQYEGTNVRKNNSLQLNAGGYLRAYRDANSTVTVGINANYQNYDNNQNYFSFGQGGYFSPQSFLSVSFPVRYAYRANQLEVDGNVVPGYQSYSQESAPLYPTDSAAQGQLDSLKLLNSDVRSRFDSVSKTGFGISAGGSAYYQIGNGTRVGGELNINTFGEYKEFRSQLGIKRQIGGGE
ncbi:MAG TPA: cellulose synthase subunit BcsC-related outer membrane protein [Sphingobium sp.]